VTDTGIKVLPTGTVAVNDVDVAAVIVALVAPKYTMLFVVVELKPPPLILTDAPGWPKIGLTVKIKGAAVTVTAVVAATVLQLVVTV
jgi:hypothetical protein